MDRRVVAWGDEDDDDYLPPRQETPVDLRGIKTVTEYKHDADGNKVKVVTKVKVFTEAMRINKKCFERKRWAKFGAAANCEDNNSFTIKSFEDIAMETPQQSKEADEQPSNISDGAPATTRPRWTMMAPAARAAAEPAAAVGWGGCDRAGLQQVSSEGGMEERMCLRLFQRFGKIYRIYLAKDQETMQSRGFAFVSFAMRSDAEKAMEALQGYGYDHLILKLEWAKPS
ncbi:unnamed protein product, partial [Phaeothamnion confervicola]